METSEHKISLLEHFYKIETDVLIYVGSINRNGYDLLCSKLESFQRQKNCLLALATFGGDPNAAYRIARAISHNYPDPGEVSILVPTYCKSAGTLVCIGAHKLIISDKGELGPVDIQVQKLDEMFKRMSGLSIIRGLEYLQESALDTFRRYLIDINRGSGLSTKTASEVASKLTTGLYGQIFAQIDPMILGEMQAEITIALEYGDRLNERYKNLKPDALHKLTKDYPSHGFVIDRKEIKDLFNNVRMPDEYEREVASFADMLFTDAAAFQREPIVDYLRNFNTNNQAESEDTDDKTRMDRATGEGDAPEKRVAGD